jgi:hypothetical protein
MINGKSGALALLGVLCWIAVAGAADSGPPVVYGANKTVDGDRITDGVLWDATPIVLGGDLAAGKRPIDPKLLHSCQLADGDDASAPCGCFWKASADVLLLHRSSSGSQPLLFDPLSQSDIFNSSNLEFPLAAGPRASVIAYGLLWGLDLEASFFAVDGWSATANFPSSALPAGFALLSLDSTFQGMQGLPVSDVRFTERSQLYNGELNVRQQLNGWVTTMAGFRWVELYDRYEAEGTKFDQTTFTHTIHAFNHMYGFQLGTEVTLFNRNRGYSQFGPTMVLCDQANPFQITGVLKGGIYYNAASQDTNFSNPGSLGEFDAHAEGKHPTFVGEAGLVATYQFGRHAMLRGGYQMMYVDGVALASRQISSTDLLATQFAAIETAGSVLYHGANVGVEFSW